MTGRPIAPPMRKGAARTRPEVILPGDHDTMTGPQLRSHYAKGCTHEACRAAVRDAARERGRARAKRKREHAIDAPPPPPQAGLTLSGSRVPARGASRRLQGLLFAGHSPVAIARRTQIGVDAIWWLLHDLVDDVDEVTHRVIDREFRLLREQEPQPQAKTAAAAEQLTTMSRHLARLHGWASPFAWEDIDQDDSPSYSSTVDASSTYSDRQRELSAERGRRWRSAQPHVAEGTDEEGEEAQ